MPTIVVPGSSFQIDHPFRWHATVEELKTAKRWQYWINGSQATKEELAAFIADRFPNVKLISAERAYTMPDRPLQPVPPHHFQYGILASIRAGGTGVPGDEPKNVSRHNSWKSIPLWRRST